MNAPARRLHVTVAGDSDAPPEACRVAEEVGALLAQLGAVVVTGGRGGAMEAACRGARGAGGVAVGILPGESAAEANGWCDVVVPTGLGHARNVLNVLAGELLVSLGASAGTLSEICHAWIQGKTVFTIRGVGGWAERLVSAPLDARRGSRIVICDDLDHLRREIEAFRGG
jgi:uncharacterized protein (TIGR00725 family)